jgi:hypothetical protein
VKQLIGLSAVAVLALSSPTPRSAEPVRPLPAGNPAESLAASLRGLLVEAVPNPLYEDDSHWGLQKMVATGVKWRGKGLQVHPEPQYQSKNHGRWWKVRVTADQLADRLTLEVRDLQRPESGKLTFTACLAFDAQVDYDRQIWDEGLRVYSAGVRARVRLKATLRCEVVTKVEAKGGLLPETVFRFRVLQSDVGYENLVVEHVAGLGGEAAKLLGEAVHAGMKQWHPSLERRLLEKANAAIVKAGDTKEVRLGVSSLLGKKKD